MLFCFRLIIQGSPFISGADQNAQRHHGYFHGAGDTFVSRPCGATFTPRTRDIICGEGNKWYLVGLKGRRGDPISKPFSTA